MHGELAELLTLSIPFGPSDVRTQSATALAAMMFELLTSLCFSLPENFIFPSPAPPDEAAAAKEAGAAAAGAAALMSTVKVKCGE